MFCRQCGNSLAEDSKFCTSCGNANEMEGALVGGSISKKEPRVKKIIGGVVGIAVFLIAYGVSRYSTQEAVTSLVNGEVKSSASIEEILIQASNETNKQLPMMIDSATQLSATMAVGKDFVYSYKLIGEDYNAVTQADLTSSIGGDIISGACTTPETKEMIDEGVRLIYRYSNEQGRYLGEIPVTLADCR